ncbi:hypothetical protein N9937_00500 [bacterium]|nr:hypothetical protein [bacterium]
MPLAQDMNINQLITGFARRYNNEEFLAERILPPVPVTKLIGKYARYDKDNLRTKNLKRLSGARGRAPVVDYGVDNATYSCEIYRLAGMVDSTENSQADAPFQPEADTTANVQDLMSIAKEKDMVDQVFASGNFASGNKTALAASTYWDAAAATGPAGPVKQVLSARSVVLTKVLRKPNLMVVGETTHTTLLTAKDITERLKFVQAITVAGVENALASIFGVSEYLVEKAVENTAVEGDTDSLSLLVADKAILLVRPTVQSTKTVAHSVQFRQNQFPNGDMWNQREEMGTKYIEVRDAYDMTTVDSSAGYIFVNTNA